MEIQTPSSYPQVTWKSSLLVTSKTVSKIKSFIIVNFSAIFQLNSKAFQITSHMVYCNVQHTLLKPIPLQKRHIFHSYWQVYIRMSSQIWKIKRQSKFNKKEINDWVTARKQIYNCQSMVHSCKYIKDACI